MKRICFWLSFLSIFAFSLGRADTVAQLTLVSTELRAGLLVGQGETAEGVYPQFFAEAAKRANVKIRFRVVPWSRAILETEKSSNYMLFPLTRNAIREPRFSWLSILWEVPICFISINRKVDSFAEAATLEGILVWRGSSHQQKLIEEGLTNIVTFDNPGLIMGILKKRVNTAWYGPCNEGRKFTDEADIETKVIVGKRVDSETLWLAGGKAFIYTDTHKRFLAAVNHLYREGFLGQLLAQNINDKESGCSDNNDMC